jgi:hypothetical protein
MDCPLRPVLPSAAYPGKSAIRSETLGYLGPAQYERQVKVA